MNSIVGAELTKSGMEAAASGMSGGKRNHEDLSDMMALVEAACKVPAISARPFAYRQAASAVTGERSKLCGRASVRMRQSVT